MLRKIIDTFKNRNTIESEQLNFLNNARNRLIVEAEFDDVDVDWQLPEKFEKQVVEGVFVGDIEWRNFELNTTKDILAAHNKWGKYASIVKHKHSNAEEHLYVIHGKLKVTLFDEKGKPSETKYVTDTQKNPFVIEKGVRHFVESEGEPTTLIVKFVK